MQANKVGSSLRARMSGPDFHQTEAAAATLSLLIRTDGPISRDTRLAIETMDGRIRTEAGDILTIDIPPSRLSELTEVPAVLFVEISEPLFRDAAESSKGEGA